MYNSFCKEIFVPTVFTATFMAVLQSTVVLTGCPDQFENYKNLTCIYYQGYDYDAVTWTDARLACRSRGMSTLVTIVDRDQETWMVTKWMDRPLTGTSSSTGDICLRQQSAWIGLVRAGYRGSEWTWDDPDGSSSYRNWHPDEPNNVDNFEDCTVLISVKTSGGGNKFDWYDSPCETRREIFLWCTKASGFFCSAPYVPDIATVSPDLLLRVAQRKTLNDAYSKTEVANNALWVTVVVLLAIVLSFAGFAIWKYQELIKRKARVFGRKTAFTEQLDAE